MIATLLWVVAVFVVMGLTLWALDEWDWHQTLKALEQGHHEGVVPHEHSEEIR